MSTIHVLQPNVANRIAAGEVVERPLSIVKELVENALDAKATSVSVEIENGGIDLIRVSDNGKGLSFEDCPLAFLRHATSKISDSEDIRHIETLGFRGEALASIASVSEVLLKTREHDADEGTVYRVDNGVEVEHNQAACTEGTVIEVRNLFSKVPARLKFLKASRTEAGYIGDYISRMILCYPNVSFSFVNNGKSVYRTYGNAELKDSVYRIYGADTITEILPIEYEDGYIRISGYIGTPTLAKANRSYQTLFVNGRYIKDFKLSNAVLRAYDTRMLIGKFPFFVLSIFLSPYEVDINVHPQKMEVRFADEMRVSNAVYSAVFRALNQQDETDVNGQPKQGDREEDDAAAISPSSVLLPGFDNMNSTIHVQPIVHSVHENIAFTSNEIKYNPTVSLPRLGNISPYSAPSKGSSIPVFDLRKKPHIESVTLTGDLNLSFPKEYKLIGKCFNGYLIIETSDKIVVIDQHAAHERILYEKLNAGTLVMDSQKLLFPQTIRLTPIDFELFFDNKEQFSSLGFEFESDSDKREVNVNAVPVINGEQIPVGAIYEAIQFISEKGDVEKRDFVRSAIIQASCKHAVKVTEVLDENEISALLDIYSSGETPLTCPHGRPVFITISQRDIEKRFKRIQ